MPVASILIADDSAEVRDILAQYLESLGHRVKTAHDGAKAIEHIGKLPFELIITDLQMPRADGLEVLQAAKARDPNTEVIILTGHPTLDSAIGALREGANNYLLKPVENLDLLRHAVENALAHRSLVLENQHLMEELRALNASLTSRVAQQTQQLREAYERLQSLDQMKARFVSVTSNELRAPLTQLLLAADALQSQLDQGSIAGAKRHLNEMVTPGQQLQRLIDNLLDFSAMDRKEFELKSGECHLPALVSATVELWRLRIEKKQIALEISMPGRDIVLSADGPRLQHALGQLLDNALKFTSPGGRIVVGAHGPMHAPWPEAGQTLFAAMAVADSGVGIPPEKQQAILKAFTEVDVSDTKRFGGLGMGLTIAARIVLAHGGRIMLKSEPGKGSTFAIWLPMR